MLRPVLVHVTQNSYLGSDLRFQLEFPGIHAQLFLGLTEPTNNLVCQDRHQVPIDSIQVQDSHLIDGCDDPLAVIPPESRPRSKTVREPMDLSLTRPHEPQAHFDRSGCPLEVVVPPS